jgi:hypothetical protein
MATIRRVLCSPARKSEVDGYIGYFEPYATGHDALDRDVAFQAEVSNAALALMVGPRDVGGFRAAGAFPH